MKGRKRKYKRKAIHNIIREGLKQWNQITRFTEGNGLPFKRSKSCLKGFVFYPHFHTTLSITRLGVKVLE
jgi:hypothetical protein